MELPEIPRTWLIAAMMLALIIMRFFGIDSWTTAALGVLIGYYTGKHVEQTTQIKYIEPIDPPPSIPNNEEKTDVVSGTLKESTG